MLSWYSTLHSILGHGGLVGVNKHACRYIRCKLPLHIAQTQHKHMGSMHAYSLNYKALCNLFCLLCFTNYSVDVTRTLDSNLVPFFCSKLISGISVNLWSNILSSTDMADLLIHAQLNISKRSTQTLRSIYMLEHINLFPKPRIEGPISIR